MPSSTSSIAGRQLQALLSDPWKTWEIWEVVKDKWVQVIETVKGERFLREEMDRIGTPQGPGTVISRLNGVKEQEERKDILLNLHHRNPKLDLANIEKADAFQVAQAVLTVLRRLP